ncbi:MAG: hypothetical protein JJ992_05800, partial [Planctomycetes bacterium]|nr:hypothetical protein [Planctomycetota bacterium]
MDKNDSRLTAYVLGELDDKDRADVDAMVAGSPELRAELESLRQTADLLGNALTETPCPELDPEQRKWIHECAHLADPSSDSAQAARHRNRRRWWVALTMAATLLVVVLLTAHQVSQRLTAGFKGKLQEMASPPAAWEAGGEDAPTDLSHRQDVYSNLDSAAPTTEQPSGEA